jgi:hypothetical protein
MEADRFRVLAPPEILSGVFLLGKGMQSLETLHSLLLKHVGFLQLQERVKFYTVLTL